MIKMTFLFEITPNYLFGYKGEEVFRAKVNYKITESNGIDDVSITIPFNCLPYILNTVTLSTDVWKAIIDHSAAFIEEMKEFNALTEGPEYNDTEEQEKRYL